MANFVVTTLDDTIDPNDGQLSLREALALANGNNSAHDTITFAANLSGGTLSLTNGELEITTGGITINGDINGDGQADITIDAGALSRVFLISDGLYAASTISATLNGLVIQGGNGLGGGVYGGGGIFVGYADALTLTNSIVSGNSNGAEYEGGGGIYGYKGAAITLINSTVSGNYARPGGGGIAGHYGVITLTNSIVSHNSTGVSTDASAGGGGILSIGGVITLTNSTVSDNSTSDSYVGGGIAGYSGCVITLTNSAVTGNSAYQGGGIFGSKNAAITLTNSTVSGNSSRSIYGSGAGIFRAPNPAMGASLTYWLKDGNPDGVKLTISDPSGTMIREISGPGRPGLNRVVWDLQIDAKHRIATVDSNRLGQTQFVPAGDYTVSATLDTGGSGRPEKMERKVTVKPAPGAVTAARPS